MFLDERVTEEIELTNKDYSFGTLLMVSADMLVQIYQYQQKYQLGEYRLEQYRSNPTSVT